MTWAFLGLVIALVALNGTELGFVIWLSRKLDESRQTEAAARELAAQRTGEIAIASSKVDQANAATATAVSSELQQASRADELEKDISDAPTPVGSGLDRLRVLAQAAGMPHAADPGNAAGSGGAGGATVPDAAATGNVPRRL